MSTITRLHQPPRRTHCTGCGIPLTFAWRSQDDPERCAECARWKAQREAVEEFVRGTDPDSAA